MKCACHKIAASVEAVKDTEVWLNGEVTVKVKMKADEVSVKITLVKADEVSV